MLLSKESQFAFLESFIMRVKKLLALIPILLASLSCSSNQCSNSEQDSIDLLLGYVYLTDRLEGSIHKIDGEGDYFKYNGALFKILIVKKGWAFGGTTRVYINGNSIENKDIDDSTFAEDQKCFGVLEYGTGDNKDPNKASYINFKTPYLESIYIEGD